MPMNGTVSIDLFDDEHDGVNTPLDEGKQLARKGNRRNTYRLTSHAPLLNSE